MEGDCLARVAEEWHHPHEWGWPRPVHARACMAFEWCWTYKVSGHTPHTIYASHARNAFAVCLLGRGGALCALCPLGSWSLGGPAASTTCTPCPLGTNTMAMGAASIDACITPGVWVQA